MPVLVIQTGSRRGERFVFERAALIGRGPLADLRLEDASVSRRHALLSAERGRCFISDLQSGNGTFVNGNRIEQPTELRDRDRVGVGRLELEFLLQEGGPVATGTRFARVTISGKQEAWNSSVSRSVVIPAASLLGTPRAADGSKVVESLRQRLGFLVNVGREIALTVDVAERLGKILEHLLEILPQADRAFVVRFDPEGGEFVPLAGRSRQGSEDQIPASRTLLEEVVRTRKAFLSSSVQEEGAFADARSVHVLGLFSVACVPLEVEGRLVGVLQVDNSQRNRPFGSQDLELLVAAAAPIALAVVNAELQRELVEREVLEHDLALARKIQHQFVPSQLPKPLGYSVAIEYSPALAVGGDLYDFFEVAGARWLFAVGDVSGKGVSGALMMARVLSELRTAAVRMVSLAALFEELNSFVERNAAEGMFVTLLMGLLEPKTGQIEIGSAGHLKPVLRRVDGRCGELAIAPARALGVSQPLGVRTFSLELRPGDLMVSFSDGLIEAANSSGARFGTTRVVDALKSARDPEDGLARLLLDARRFLAGAPFDDDLTVLALGRRS